MASSDKKAPSLELEQRALNHVTKFMKDSRDHYSNYFERFLHEVELFLNNRDAWKKKNIRANLKPPTVFRQIESFVPQMAAAIWDYTEDSIGVKPWIPNPQDQDISDSRNLTRWVTYKLDRAKFVPNLIVFLKDLLLHGTAIIKCPWVKQYKKIIERTTEMDPITGESFVNKDEVKRLIYNNMKLDTIKLIDFFPSPRAYKPGDIQAMDGCAHRFWRNFHDLWNKRKVMREDGPDRGVYINLDKLKLEWKDKATDAWYNASRVGVTDNDHIKYDKAKKSTLNIIKIIVIKKYMNINYINKKNLI